EPPAGPTAALLPWCPASRPSSHVADLLTASSLPGGASACLASCATSSAPIAEPSGPRQARPAPPPTPRAPPQMQALRALDPAGREVPASAGVREIGRAHV